MFLWGEVKEFWYFEVFELCEEKKKNGSVRVIRRYWFFGSRFFSFMTKE